MLLWRKKAVKSGHHSGNGNSDESSPVESVPLSEEEIEKREKLSKRLHKLAPAERIAVINVAVARTGFKQVFQDKKPSFIAKAKQLSKDCYNYDATTLSSIAEARGEFRQSLSRSKVNTSPQKQNKPGSSGGQQKAKGKLSMENSETEEVSEWADESKGRVTMAVENPKGLKIEGKGTSFNLNYTPNPGTSKKQDDTNK